MSTECAMRYNVERIRATRTEVARLSALRYREPLTAEQRDIVERSIAELVATLPEADQVTWADSQITTHGIDLDWTILDNEQVTRALASAVRSVIRQYGPEKLSATDDDLTQAGRIILAERAKAARRELSKGYGYLQSWIWQRLTDLVKYEHRDSSINAMGHFVEDGDPKFSGAWMGKPFHRGTWR